jgi:hypothetical protein
MEQFDGTVNAGRKGVAYDWQSLIAEAEIARLEATLASFTPATAAPGAA